MTKENLEIYQEVFPKSQLRRMKVVDEYLNTFGEMIKKKVISPVSFWRSVVVLSALMTATCPLYSGSVMF